MLCRLYGSVVACAQYAQRYLTERKMPDKAVDLLDEAAARLRMQQEVFLSLSYHHIVLIMGRAV
jgi:ATP-dependent Clp protease ATP-binding subunit ClpA